MAAAAADSACSTPFVSAPSSPARDHHHFPFLPAHHGACFFSAPASPTRVSGGASDLAGGGTGCLDFDFDFDFSSPSAAGMSSADELFHNGQIRLAAALLQPQQPAEEEEGAGERGRVRSRSVRRKARSMSPFRAHWRSPSPAPALEAQSFDEPLAAAATPAASRSSSSSSTASSASSSSSRGSRRWGFFKDLLLHRSKSDGGKNHHHSHLPAAPTPASPTAAPKRVPSPSPSSSPSPAAAARGRGGGTAPGARGTRRSAHERLYEARRAEEEEMRRRTYLPYRQGLLLFGCIGLGNRGVHGLARGLNAVSSRS